MQAYEVQGPSGIDGLELVECPIPQPGPGEVLVRIRAVTLNYRDLLTVEGGYGSRQKFPLIPLSDAAGIVEAVGPVVTRFKPGDRVFNSFFQSWIYGPPSEAKLSNSSICHCYLLESTNWFPSASLKMDDVPHASFFGSCANSTPLDFSVFAVANTSSVQNASG